MLGDFPKAHYIKMPAGLGKTTAAAKAIAKSSGTTSVYVPTHHIGEQFADMTRQFAKGKIITHIHGRGHVDADGVPFCFRNQDAQAVAKIGLPVFPLLCRRKVGANKPGILCPHFNTCKYIQQYQPSDVVIYPHAYLTMERCSVDLHCPNQILIDENFTNNCWEKLQIPIDILIDHRLPSEAAPLCADIYRFLLNNDWTGVLGSINSEIRNGNLFRVICVLTKLDYKVRPDQTGSTLSNHISNARSFAPVAKIIVYLFRWASGRTMQPERIWFEPQSRGIFLLDRKPIKHFIPPFWEKFTGTVNPPSIKILDATGSERLAGNFFDITRSDSRHLRRNARVIQCVSTRCATSSLVPNPKASASITDKANRKLGDINHMLVRLSQRHPKTLVVGPQKIVGNPKHNIAPKIKLQPGMQTIHFNGLRGSNEWKDFDAIVVIGRNQPSIKDVEDEAIAMQPISLFGTPITRAQRWQIEERGYRMSSQEKIGVEVEVHPDPRVQVILEQIRESETLQAIDRLRLIHCKEPKHVYLLSNLPVDVEVDELLTWEEITHGTRLERAIEASGLPTLPLVPSWLAKNHPNLWATKIAAKNDMVRVINKHQLSNNSTYKKLLLFKFKPTKQRRWSHCLSERADISDVAADLMALLGYPVQIKVDGDK